ncbi:MAG: FkbM family methyltransferase [Sedimenticola sp.]
MSFISYAQNLEDVMLWRALSHIEHGFYIDVGAWSADQDSVTRAFYERQWCGINVEPNPIYNRQLCERRPRDINLKVAVGDVEDTLVMNFLDNSGLSTLDNSIAEKYQKDGWTVEHQEVGVKTLLFIWQKHVDANQEVHFLKVDVEGFEERVLKGNDWTKYRPWIVLIEATFPMSQVESYEVWEPILLSANYKFAYADGLNRFYVAHEHSELLPRFKYPPNVFDNYYLVSQQESENRAIKAETKAKQDEEKVKQAESIVEEAEAKFEKAEDKAKQAMAKAEQAKVKAKQAEYKARQAEAKAEQFETKFEQTAAKAEQAEDKAKQSEAKVEQIDIALNQVSTQLRAVYTSTSWRISAPLRMLKRILSGDLSQFTRCASNFRSAFARVPGIRKAYRLIRYSMGHSIRFSNRHPRLKKIILSFIRNFPVLERWMIERRTAQLRVDFPSNDSKQAEGQSCLYSPQADLSLQMNLQLGQRSVDEILVRIREELASR